MADGVIAVDNNMKVVLYNGAALNILDINAIITGKDIGSILHITDKNKNEIDVDNYIRGIKTATSSRDMLIHYGDSSYINLYLSVAPVHLGYGHNSDQGYILLLRDITHEKSLEEERDEFISVVSHELRTPIAITEGNISNAQLIAEKTGDIQKIKQALNEAYTQIGFLSGLINDLSTLSRAERGKLILEIEDINAHDLVNELVESYQQQAVKKGLQIHSEIDPSLEVLKSSRLYVREILQNFITNAIKYTEKGYVTIRAKSQPGGILFSVNDTGIGISKSDQEKVFNKFFRSEDYRTRQHNGTGLGLYVTMKLIKLINARLRLVSELNKGSTFEVFIPNLEALTA